jgi:hypothetical protein
MQRKPFGLLPGEKPLFGLLHFQPARSLLLGEPLLLLAAELRKALAVLFLRLLAPTLLLHILLGLRPLPHELFRWGGIVVVAPKAVLKLAVLA